MSQVTEVLALLTALDKSFDLLFRRATKEIVERRETGFVKPTPSTLMQPGSTFYEDMKTGIVMDLATEHVVFTLGLVPTGAEPSDAAMMMADSIISAMHSSGALVYDRVDSREIVRWSEEFLESYTS